MSAQESEAEWSVTLRFNDKSMDKLRERLQMKEGESLALFINSFFDTLRDKGIEGAIEWLKNRDSR